MNLFFDVDYTFLAMDGSLRPGTSQVFSRLVEDGHRLYVWSGVGIREAELARHGLRGYVSDVYWKPLEDYESALESLGVAVRPDLVIDDHAGIVNAFGGILVWPYYYPAHDDDEMETIYQIIRECAEKGRSEHYKFRPGGRGNLKTPPR